MTVQIDSPTPMEKTIERPIPEIDCEEDVPFTGESEQCSGLRSINLTKSESLDDQITKFKYTTGRKVLFISMIAMGVAVVASIFLSAFEIKNTLVENAFEVFKLSAMTVLGYIFGSKSK